MDQAQRLQAFGLSPTDLIGQGGESRVFAGPDGRVLKLYHGASEPLIDSLKRRQTFYTWLRKQNLPCESPEILEIGPDAGGAWTWERRMQGQDFAKILPGLTGSARRQALTSYLNLAESIGELQAPEQPWGEILRADAIQLSSWPAVLEARSKAILNQSSAWLCQDLPALTQVLQTFSAGLERLAQQPINKSLVHGDYFPGNVFINQELQICGVGDFGYTTLIGDRRMDIVGALIFLEVVTGHQSEDTLWLSETLCARHGQGFSETIDFYRLYYSLYFSGCKHSDPPTYAWCLNNLIRSIRSTRSAD